MAPASPREGLPSLAAFGEIKMSTHKFAVGQTVRFTPDLGQDSTGPRSFKVVRLLPEEASILQYRVKSQSDGHERIVREDQLARL